jgi:hypothetical protein
LQLLSALKNDLFFCGCAKIFVDRPPISEKKLDQLSVKAGGGHYSQSPPTKSTIPLPRHTQRTAALRTSTPPPFFLEAVSSAYKTTRKNPKKKSPTPFFKNQNKRV